MARPLPLLALLLLASCNGGGSGDTGSSSSGGSSSGSATSGATSGHASSSTATSSAPSTSGAGASSASREGSSSAVAASSSSAATSASPGSSGPAASSGTTSSSSAPSTCDNGVQDGDETNVDCGGQCRPCMPCVNGACDNGDQCNDPGTCNPVTNLCSPASAVQNGTACISGNACTDFDFCWDGTCREGGPIDCPAGNECQVPTCDPVTGCGLVNALDGTPCNGGGCRGGACDTEMIMNVDDTGPCYTACTLDWQCASSDEGCFHHQCRVKPFVRSCTDVGTAGNLAGDRWDCGTFLCDTATGLCKTTCNSSSDDCIASAPCTGPGGFCQGSGVAGGWYVSPTLEAAHCARPACSVDTDCRTFENCRHGTCMVNDAHCTQADQFTDITGNAEACGNYRCNPLLSQFGAGCGQSCLFSADCMSWSSCNPLNHACE